VQLLFILQYSLGHPSELTVGIVGKHAIFVDTAKQTMLDLRKTLTLLVLLPVFCIPAHSQRRDSFWRKIVDVISAPSMELDPSAVYQPAARWSVAVSGELHQAGITQQNDIDCFSTFTEEEGGRFDEVEAFASSKLLGGLDKGIGIQVGYGNLALGWNQRIGGDKGNTNTTFSFDYLAPGYAFQLQYFDFRRPVDYEMRISLGDGGYWDLEGSGQTDHPGRMTTIIADAFYAFNRRSFAYSAAYKGNVVQRRSAGTWMFGVKYLQGLVEYDPDESIVSDMLFGLARQDTRQVSFGGGFSYNLVPFHRQPGEDGKGLRNLTFNVTAIPMVSLFNQFSSTMKNPFLEENPVMVKNVINGKLHVNYVFKAGAIYSWDRFFLNLSGSYDSYNYKGATKIPEEFSDEYIKLDKIHSSGRFSRWSASLKLCVKF
jgi:hypothetical protein